MSMAIRTLTHTATIGGRLGSGIPHTSNDLPRVLINWSTEKIQAALPQNERW